jgi:hypothetical protein
MDEKLPGNGGESIGMERGRPVKEQIE